MEKTYQITGFQLVYSNGTRDNVKLQQPVLTNNIDHYRAHVKQEYECACVNLSYIEMPQN